LGWDANTLVAEGICFQKAVNQKAAGELEFEGLGDNQINQDDIQTDQNDG